MRKWEGEKGLLNISIFHYIHVHVSPTSSSLRPCFYRLRLSIYSSIHLYPSIHFIFIHPFTCLIIDFYIFHFQLSVLFGRASIASVHSSPHPSMHSSPHSFDAKQLWDAADAARDGLFSQKDRSVRIQCSSKIHIIEIYN